MTAEIVVVGSLNRDLSVTVPSLPHPGETVLGGDLRIDAGGKGANQAVAAARLERSVTMVGRVGDDAAGEDLRGALAAAGVDTSRVAVDAGSHTGTALITVDPYGENAIVVAPGANARVVAGDVEAAAQDLSAAAVTLAQLEIPIEAVRRAAELAGGRFVLNPAPAPGGPLPDGLLARVDVLVPNRTELAILAGAAEPQTRDEAIDLARTLSNASTVIVTLGVDGAVIVQRSRVITIPAPGVDAVDTTAAGDAFCGALADGLTAGADLAAAARRAAAAAAVAVTRWGAQSSLPTRAEVEEMLEQAG